MQRYDENEPTAWSITAADLVDFEDTIFEVYLTEGEGIPACEEAITLEPVRVSDTYPTDPVRELRLRDKMCILVVHHGEEEDKLDKKEPTTKPMDVDNVNEEHKEEQQQEEEHGGTRRRH